MNGRFALGPEVKRSATTGGAMLYDTSRAGNLSAEWFEPRYWEAQGALEGSASRGRAATRFVNGGDGRRYVLRHYCRGGLMARLSADRFVWRGEETTRPFAEWQLTYRLHRAGLPVPAPIAARYSHAGSSYSGDIITERLAVVGSLADCLQTGALATLTWIAIGRCIRRFHDLGVCHADLNAHNVLLSEESVYLIDFDRCQLRAPGLWRDGNLVRLRRSLEKVTWSVPAERFGESDWHALLDGYRQAAARSEPSPA
ncbi:MAG: 3-deoxy-D-manno-octulosonic acid kinase [Gammaproteobacteria bacterium]|nr:3-deoxy-D-manno-octulosonic acid kinase [Gammaproteobacteria bacterium]MBV8307221.1 3-deoxy-D-manno-octulosonic acid kinase [Gammaproteobacteria bacterium]MBV8403285.1 3-deoxy-D-manno-octulosonic acid kinase [Gammaproteobacteria bacterium]